MRALFYLECGGSPGTKPNPPRVPTNHKVKLNADVHVVATLCPCLISAVFITQAPTLSEKLLKRVP